MLLHVTNARYLDDYKIEVTFDNGKKGVADLGDALTGPVFMPLRDPSKFSAFQVDATLKTIVWPNGVDLAPEYIYFQAFKNDPALQPLFRQWGYID